MKKLIIVLVLSMALMLPGCALLDWVFPDPEPEPEPLVVVNAILEGWDVDWSIENISEDHIYDYSLTFTIKYTEVKTQWTEVVTGTNLYPGDIDYGTLALPVVGGMEPDTLTTVLATY